MQNRTIERWATNGGAYYGRRWTVWTARNAGPARWALSQNLTDAADVRALRVVYAEVWTGGRVWFIGRRLRGFDTPVSVADRGVW